MCRWSLVLFALLGCDDAPYAPRLDLDGPRGQAVGPGPWRVQVAADTQPAVFAQIGDGPFAMVPLARALDGWGGLLPDAPVGTEIRYYARAGTAVEPAAGEAEPRRFTVVPAGRPPSPPAGGCTMRFRWPIEGLEVTPLADGAPQAGVQLVVVVETNLADGHAARLGLSVGDAEVDSYSGVAGTGVVAFDAVTIPEGVVELVAEATVPGGDACAARVTVRR